MHVLLELPDEVCDSHTKRVGDNKTILQLKKFAEVLVAGSLQPLDNQCGKRHIAKGWSKARISELVQGKTISSPEDPFGNIEPILI